MIKEFKEFLLKQNAIALAIGVIIGAAIGKVVSALVENVLNPIGWDAFGLPAENAAIKNKVPPAKWTYDNIAAMKAQMQAMGLAIDWSREVATCDPAYYKHQQRMFLDFLKAGLVFADRVTTALFADGRVERFARARDEGVLANPVGPRRIRLVTHLDVDRADRRQMSQHRLADRDVLELDLVGELDGRADRVGRLSLEPCHPGREHGHLVRKHILRRAAREVEVAVLRQIDRRRLVGRRVVVDGEQIVVVERDRVLAGRDPHQAVAILSPIIAHVNLRFLHYPPQESDDPEQFGQGPHTDNSFITILARMDVPGLAVRLPSGEWLAPPVIPGTFLVNLGNVMKRWSNDRFLSTPHGVLNDSGTDRYSIAFFYSPNVDSVIECLPSCVGPDNPPRYEPAVYRDLVLAFYNANYFHRQGYAAEGAR